MSSDLDSEQFTQHVKPFVLPQVVRWHDRDPGDETDNVHVVHEHCDGYGKGFVCCGCGQHKEA